MPPDYSLAGDFDLWSRFFEHADLHAVNAPLGAFRIRAGQRSEQRQAYCEQAMQSLTAMRRRCGWKPKRLRKLVSRIPQWRLPPSTRDALNRRFGYRAGKVVRQDPGTPHGTWAAYDVYYL